MPSPLPPSCRTISLGKFGSFPASALIDKPYGITYQIVDASADVPDSKATLKALKGEGLADVGQSSSSSSLPSPA